MFCVPLLPSLPGISMFPYLQRVPLIPLLSLITKLTSAVCSVWLRVRTTRFSLCGHFLSSCPLFRNIVVFCKYLASCGRDVRT